MRLIDADALKVEVNNKKVVGRFNTLLLIDNAPTVEYPFYQEAYQTGYEEGKNERVEGTWRTNLMGDIVCSCCKQIRRDNRTGHINFCNSCGAKMIKPG